MHINGNTVVSDNLPIYFIWFDSDVPSKYFGNLLRAAETNKPRDIILVYSEKYLPKDNRKNIDNIENIKINEIKERVELKRDSETKNLFKIDVYGMELDKQDETIYGLFNKAFKTLHFYNGKKYLSYKYCVASDLIRLPLLNITGGIYLDMDTEIIGEIGEIEAKNGYNINFYYPEGREDLNTTGNIIAKAQHSWNDLKRFKEAGFHKELYFQKLMKKYIGDVSKVIDNEYEDGGSDNDPVNYLGDYIRNHYLKSYFGEHIRFIIAKHHNDCWWKVENKKLRFCFREGETYYRLESEVNEVMQSEVFKPMISDYGIRVPQAIRLNMKQGETYSLDHNDPEQLKKLGLDKQDYSISSKLENSSLEQPGGGQEKGR